MLKRHFLATRPSFLPASILPMLVGSAWGWREVGEFDLLPFMVALLTVVLVHAGANVVNDVVDERTRTDRLNIGRIHPFTGGSRFIQNGIMSSAQMARWGGALLVTGAALGFSLAILKGPMAFVFGAIGLGLGVAYSIPPLALNSRGLGELSVAIGFGTLPVVGSYWLQTGVVSSNAVLLSLPLAFWITAVLVMNQLPDVEADAMAGKRTLVVRLRTSGSRCLYLTLQLAAFCACLIAVSLGMLPPVGLIPWPVLLVLGAVSARSIGGSRESLRGGILCTLAIHALGGTWLAGLGLLSF